MPGLGTNGTFTDENENEYVAIVVGHTFAMATVWRNPAGEIVPDDPTPTVPVPPGSTSKLERVENGNLEILTIFRDGGLKVRSNVPPSAILPVVA
jgi:hypothetical protein